jgi:hypothetical protein
LATNDHFSSNWTSRVRGGKSHALVVDVLGLAAGDQSQPDHGVFVDPDQAAGLADATTFLEMLEDGQGFVVAQFTAVQGRAFAFGEAALTGATGQNAAVFVGTIAESDAQISEATAAVVGAARVLAAEGFQVVHQRFPPGEA